MPAQSDGEELVQRFETLIAGHGHLLNVQASSRRNRLAELLDGFLAVSRKSEAEESQRTGSSLVRVLDSLISGYDQAHAKWADAQRGSADEFNLFEVMEVQYKEACHSRLLAWLLDPRIEHGTHAQGNLGFRMFLHELEKELDPQLNRHITAYADEPYWVRREVAGVESRVDIEIAARKRFVIHIENKILAAEGEDQTNREWEELQQRANELEIPQEDVHAVFLTLDGSEPENKKFRPIAWKRIARVLEEFGEHAQPPEVRLFVRHYAKALRKVEVRQSRAEEIENAEALVQRTRALPAAKMGGCAPAGRLDEGGA